MHMGAKNNPFSKQPKQQTLITCHVTPDAISMACIQRPTPGDSEIQRDQAVLLKIHMY